MRRKHGLESLTVSPEAHAALRAYAWPGNAREVRNAIEAAALCSNGRIEADNLPPDIRAGLAPLSATRPTLRETAPTETLGSVRDYERQIIVSMLRKHRKANRVAIVLGIARSTLYRKFAELDINPAEFTGAGAGPDETH